MDAIELNLKEDKRIYSVNISQSMNLRKLIDDYIEANLKDKTYDYLYIGTDEQYAKDILQLKNYFYDYFDVIEYNDGVRYELKKDIPQCEVLFVILDGYPDNDIYRLILENTNINCNIVYLYDSLIVDYSDGDFYKKHSVADCTINTFNRRVDTKLAISTLLNKLKKYNFQYINDPELTHADECMITYEDVKSEELLDYDKVILVNNDNCAQYTTDIRKLLARGFLPEERDKMIAYQSICTTYLNEETGLREEITIPIFSELTVIGPTYDIVEGVPPTYKFEYIRGDKTYEIDIAISLGFIDDLNGGLVDCDIPIVYKGYKVYYGYVIPLFAVTRRYDNVLLVVDDSVLNKDTVYTAISYAKEKFKLSYKTNVYMG